MTIKHFVVVEMAKTIADFSAGLFYQKRIEYKNLNRQRGFFVRFVSSEIEIAA
jgi:hypothetical protein